MTIVPLTYPFSKKGALWSIHFRKNFAIFKVLSFYAYKRNTFVLDYLIVILKIFLFLLGGVLIYFGAFLYEDEEKKINNQLEDFWIRIDDHAKLSLSRHRKIILISAKFVSQLLLKIFGEQLVSPTSLKASFFFSFSSLFLSYSLVLVWSLLTDTFEQKGVILAASTFLCGSFSFYAAYSQTKWNSESCAFQWAQRALIVLILFFLSYFALLFRTLSGNYMFILSSLALLVAFMVLSDFFFIVVTRKVLRFATIKTKAVRAYLLLIGNTLLIMVLALLPLMATAYFFEHSDTPFPKNPGDTDLVLDAKKYGRWGNIMILVFMFIPLSSIPAIVISTMVLGLILLLYIHKLVWPLVARPAYAFQRNGILKYRKGLVALGVFFMGFAIPDTIELVSDILKSLI